jgi:hypothetical protein
MKKFFTGMKTRLKWVEGEKAGMPSVAAAEH